MWKVCLYFRSRSESSRIFSCVSYPKFSIFPQFLPISTIFPLHSKHILPMFTHNLPVFHPSKPLCWQCQKKDMDRSYFVLLYKTTFRLVHDNITIFKVYFLEFIYQMSRTDHKLSKYKDCKSFCRSETRQS